jgi:site-specific DNA-adenine methylase
MPRHYQTQLRELGLTEPGARLSFTKLSDVNNPSSVHGIYPYRGKISAIDAQQVIHQLPHERTLLDPFCGSGTIVYEAQKWGMNAVGVDSNPIACVLSKAKTQRVDNKKIIAHSQEIAHRAKSLSSVGIMSEWPRKFFHPATAEEIMRVLHSRNEMAEYELAAFYGAIALTARACNHYKWSSTSIGKIITPLIYVDFYEKFLSKIRKHIKFVDGNSPAKIVQGDSRRLSNIIDENSIDYVYTSPPYFDALDYTSYYTKIIYEVDDYYNRRDIRRNLIQDFSSYPEDMRIVLSEIRKVAREGATVIFVVGDKKTEEGTINGGSFFSQLTSWKPAYVVEREYTGSSSQIWDKINRTRRKEQIVVWINE